MLVPIEGVVRVHLRGVLRFAGAGLFALVVGHAPGARAQDAQLLGPVPPFRAPASPDPDGGIRGTVVAAETKQPLPDVVVSATSPSLQGEQVVVTDSQGQYRIPDLPPGLYTLRFERESFRPYARSDLSLRDGYALRVDVELLEERDDEGITIGPCGPPTIDVGSATTGLMLSPDLPQHLAVSRPGGRNGAVRTFDSLAELAPGVRAGANGLSIHGATAFENRYVVDGLSTNAPASGVNALPLSTEFIQDVNVITGGYMPEYGRATGGILAATLPYGSNELHGSVFGYWAPGVLAARDTPAGSSLKNLGDFGATLGGPLVKDRLWFFAGMAPALRRVEQARSFADQRTVQALAKLTYLINMDHNVSLSFITTPTSSTGAVGSLPGGGDSLNAEAPHELDSNATSAGLTYAAAFLDKKLLLDTHAGWLHQRAASPSGGEDSDPRLVRIQDHVQANTRLTYLRSALGTHVIKAGVDTELLTATSDSRATGRVLGGFVQDSWNILNQFTLNAGLRYDVQWLRAGDGAPTQRLGGSPLSPRLGLVVDPWVNGRMKVFANVAKYQSLVPLGLLTSPARRVTVDPDLAPPSSRELVVGADYELLFYNRVGASYTHRRLDTALQYLPLGDGSGVLLGNPGAGLASDTPKEERTYDAVTLELSRLFSEGWLAQLSYTWARLRGDAPGLVPLPSEPDLTSDPASLALLGRTHTLKANMARELSLTRELTLDAGLSYLGVSGTPLDGGGRTPWVHTVDAHLGAGYRLSRDTRVAFSLDVFNLLNTREATRVEGGLPLQYQTPRQVRLGARYAF